MKTGDRSFTLTSLNQIQQKYKSNSWRRQNLSTAFIVESLLVIGFFTGSLYWSNILNLFRKSRIELPESEIPISELAPVQIILRSITNWQIFFKQNQTSTGLLASLSIMAYASIMIPLAIILFVILFPPFFFSYIVWLAYHYTDDAIHLAVGFFKTLAKFAVDYVRAMIANVNIKFNLSPIKFIKLNIRSRLGKLGGIGISTRFPKFKEELYRWRQVYFDPIILREKSIYIDKVNQFRKRWLVDPFKEGPLDTYVISPIWRAVIEFNFLRDTAVNRTTNIFNNSINYWTRGFSKSNVESETTLNLAWILHLSWIQYLYLLAGLVIGGTGILSLFMFSNFQLPALVLVIISIFFSFKAWR